MSSTSLKNSLSGALLNLGVDLLTVVPDVLDLLEELLEGALLVPHPHLKVVSLFDVGILLHCSQTVLWRRHPENFLVFFLRKPPFWLDLSPHMDLCQPRSRQLPVKLNVQRQISCRSESSNKSLV